MKLTSPFLCAFLAASVSASAEEAQAGTPPQAATARIIGEIPDGTPPPETAPKPQYKVAASDVLDTTTHDEGGRTITIQRIKPVALPPPPPPAEAGTAAADAEFSQCLAEYQQTHPRNELLFLGATVYRSDDGPPRTLVRWWPQGGNGTITFWSSADFSLIAGGVQSFRDTAGETHGILMGWGEEHIDRMGDIYAARGLAYQAPEIPVFPAGEAAFRITGARQPDAEELVVIQSLHDVYNSELARLKTAHEGRERARADREAYLKAHPPRPKDITLRYWRTETPAGGAAKGGER